MALFALQGAFTVFSAGSLRFQKPEGGIAVWLYNALNLGTILILTPLVALCLLRGWTAPLGWAGFTLPSGVSRIVSGIGLGCFVGASLLQYWSRAVLGRSFRLGAVPPGEEDKLVERGPFAFIRHPMYTSVLLYSVGLGLALFSFVFLMAFAGLLVLILILIPVEEAQLAQHYGAAYHAYTQRTRRLLPFLY